MDTINLPVLIYQPGRSGSHTIKKTLRMNGIPCIPLHTLVWKSILSDIKLHPENKELNHIRYTTRRTIDLAPDNVRWKVITIVREPVAQICSGVLENRDRFFPHLANRLDEQMFAAIMDGTHSRLKSFGTEESYITKWFDREIKEVFNFDVFSAPFDRSQGFQIYRSPRADILLFKSEYISECFQQAFSLFFGRNITQLHSTNMTKDKPNAQMYNRAKRALKLPLCDLQNIYSHRYVKTFYSSDQIEGFVQRWSSEDSCLSNQIKSFCQLQR